MGRVEDAERVDRQGHWAQQAEALLPDRRYREEIERGLAYGLEAADSITDRTLPTFARGEIPHFAGERGTFMKCPYVEDVHEVGDAEVAIFGAPLDAGTTYRPGTRFGPQGIRRATNLFGTYNFELGVDLREQLNLVDIGDVCAIPGNLEKSFDQISKAMSHVVSSGVLPGGAGRRPLHRLPHHPRAWRRTWTATSASSTSTGTSTPRSSTWTSGCTPRRGSMPPTSRTRRRRTWCRSASAAGRRPAPG